MKRKFLRRAFKSAVKANELKPEDENVLQQISELKLLKSRKGIISNSDNKEE